MARPTVKKGDMEEAAIRLFAGRGLARTTIKDIAAEAGVTEGALYRHWPGKNEMAWELYRRELGALARELRQALFAEGGGFSERLRRAVAFLYERYAREPVRFAFIMLTQHGFPEENIPDPEENPHDLAVRFLAQAMERGEIGRRDPALAAWMVLGLVMQPLLMRHHGRLASLDGAADEVAAAALRVVEPGEA